MRSTSGRVPASSAFMAHTWGYTEAVTAGVASLLTTVGLAGFLVTGFRDVTGDAGATIVGFGINPLHNVVHLVIGVIGLVAWGRFRTAVAYGALLLVGSGILVAYGLSAVLEQWDVLAMNDADIALHAALATFGAVILTLGRWELDLAEAAELPEEVHGDALEPGTLDTLLDSAGLGAPTTQVDQRDHLADHAW